MHSLLVVSNNSVIYCIMKDLYHIIALNRKSLNRELFFCHQSLEYSQLVRKSLQHISYFQGKPVFIDGHSH